MSDFTTNMTAFRRDDAMDRFLNAMKKLRVALIGDQPDVRAIKELEGLEEYQLADIGLCRSDLTLDGLATAAARRAREQRAIDRQCRTWREAA